MNLEVVKSPPRAGSSLVLGLRQTWKVLASLLLLLGVTALCAAEPSMPGPGFRGENTPPPLCEDGVVYDDGSLETGYGYVPSVFEGQYLQRFDPADLPTRDLESVCVCWLRTRADDSISYDVVLYEDRDGEPDFLPYAVIPATTTGVPEGIVGKFDEVETPGVRLPDGPAWVGVRWDAGTDQFFFVCADHGPADDFVSETSFSFDRGRNWIPVLESGDPIFAEHRALMVRLRTRGVRPVEIPAADRRGLGVLGLLIGLAGGVVLLSVRRRSNGSAP